MIQRFSVIALVIAAVFSLMAVKNWVLTGEQELHANLRVEVSDDQVPAGAEVEVVLADLAGREVAASEDELEQLAPRLTGEADRDMPQLTVDLDTLKIDPSTNRMSFELGEPATMSDLRHAITGKTFSRENPPLPLWYAPLGIDLRGGVEFRLALYDDDGRRVSADDEVVSILRSRLDARGLSEPQVSRLSNGDVQVVIPGGTQADAARTRRILQTSGRLEFREVMEEYTREPGNMVVEVEPGVYRLSDNAPVSVGFNEVLYPAKPQFRGEQPTTFYRLGPPGLTGQDVDAAYPTTHQGQRAVGMTFTAAGAAKNNRFTSSIHSRGSPENGGDGSGSGRMAISLDGYVESAPQIISPSGRHSVITGRFTQEEIDQLSTVLKAGSLAVTPQVLAERVVGPSLGAETVAKAMWTMVAALGLILLTMLVYYKRLGTVAVISLVSTVALLFGVLVIFGATLTLPGIAGLVLTVGMAVDSNILIFERVREELREDTDLQSCIEAGYGRALATIIDANVTTFLVALILYLIGSGPVQGFGLTLMIGIGTSMFSAVYIGRTITNLLYARRESAEVPDWVGEPRLPYVRWRYPAFVISAIMVTLGILEFFVWTSPNRNFDIDFTGGNMIQVTFTQDMDQAAVEQGLQRAADAGLTHLAPGEVQMQPYYQGFGADEGGARQWMFKARDEEAAALEAELSQLENEIARLSREANNFRTEDPPQESKAIAADRQRQELLPRARELQDRISAQTQILAQQFREHAFPDTIAEPGDEIQQMAVNDAELQLRLQIIDPVDDPILNRLSEQISEAPGVHSATVAAAEAALDLRLQLNQAPTAQAEYQIDDPAAERLRALLAAQNPETPAEELNGQAAAAYDAYILLNEAAAAERIRTARPFPSQEHFSGLVATQMKMQAGLALLVALIGILLYVAARFEFRYGVGAVVALFHDIPITMGLLVLLGLRIDLTVVAALLTIIGYSLNDTIVVFDRIREVRKLNPLESMARVIDSAIAQTMSRTVMTTLTTLSVVVLLYLFGGEGVEAFSMTLIIGLILGTYSSIFIAAPVLLFMDRRLPPEALAEEPDDDVPYGPGAEFEPKPQV